MKKNLITFMIVFAMTALCGQAAKPVDGIIHDRGIKVTAMFGASLLPNHVDKDRPTTHIKSHGGFVISPRIGFSFNSRWEVGVIYRYESNGEYKDNDEFDFCDCKYHNHGIGAYGEYRYASLFQSRLRFFVDFTSLLIIDTSKIFSGVYEDENKKYCQIGFTPGVMYRIPGCNVDLRLEYLFLGFDTLNRYHRNTRGCLGDKNFVLDAGLRRLAIGASYTF